MLNILVSVEVFKDAVLEFYLSHKGLFFVLVQDKKVTAYPTLISLLSSAKGVNITDVYNSNKFEGFDIMSLFIYDDEAVIC